MNVEVKKKERIILMVEIYKVKNEEDMQIVRNIRLEVFVAEQGVPVELEMDEFDKDAIHVLSLRDGEPAGCGRLIINGDDAKIGRVAVREKMRRNGIGGAICKLLIAIAADNGAKQVYLGAQLTAVDLYLSLGFEREGDIFKEAGIEHIKMVKNI